MVVSDIIATFSSGLLFDYREITSVGEHSPKPFQRSEAEMPEPNATHNDLNNKNCKGYQFYIDEAKTGANSESKAIEQQNPNERMGDITTKCHTSWGSEPSEYRSLGIQQIKQAYTYY